MTALNIGVRDAQSGTPIIRGGERGVQDFYLYDFEIDALIAAAGHYRKVGDVVSTLQRLAVVDNGLSAEALWDDMIADCTDLYHPDYSSGIRPLMLIREIGLTRGRKSTNDLCGSATVDTYLLEPICAFLLALDLLIPHGTVDIDSPDAWDPPADYAPDRTAAANADANDDGADQWFIPAGWAAAASSGLNWPKKIPLPIEGPGTGKWPTGRIKTAGQGATIAMIAITGIHGVLLEYSIMQFSVDTSGTESKPVHNRDDSPLAYATHWGHGEPGKDIRFTLLVQMMENWTRNPAFGPMSPLTMPKQGPIAGVPVVWTYDDLEDQADKIVFDPVDEQTGADGRSNLIFTPKTEKLPGFGKPTSKLCVVEAYAEPLSVTLVDMFKVPIPIKVGKFIGWLIDKAYGRARTLLFYVTVSSHQAQGLRFGPVVMPWNRLESDGTTTHFVVQLWGYCTSGDPYIPVGTVGTPEAGWHLLRYEQQFTDDQGAWRPTPEGGEIGEPRMQFTEGGGDFVATSEDLSGTYVSARLIVPTGAGTAPSIYFTLTPTPWEAQGSGMPTLSGSADIEDWPAAEGPWPKRGKGGNAWPSAFEPPVKTIPPTQ